MDNNITEHLEKLAKLKTKTELDTIHEEWLRCKGKIQKYVCVENSMNNNIGFVV